MLSLSTWLVQESDFQDTQKEKRTLAHAKKKTENKTIKHETVNEIKNKTRDSFSDGISILASYRPP
jgi:hypothetical protein